MIRIATFLAACLLAGVAIAAPTDPALYTTYDAGATLTARVFTGTSSGVAVSLTAGSGSNTTYYFVTNATLAGAGLSADGDYLYRITNANGQEVGTGQIHWRTNESRDVLLAGDSVLLTPDGLDDIAEETRDLIYASARSSFNAANTMGELFNTLFAKLPSDQRRMAGAGLQVTNLDDVEGGTGGGGETPLLYLGEPDFVWALPKRSTRRLYAEDPLRIAAGETIRAGFKVEGTIVLPTGAVPSEPQEPTGLSGDLGAELAGISPRYVTLTVSAGPDAEVGEEQWVQVEVSNTSGGGPFILSGRVVVAAAHPEDGD